MVSISPVFGWAAGAALGKCAGSRGLRCAGLGGFGSGGMSSARLDQFARGKTDSSDTVKQDVGGRLGAERGRAP